MTERARFRPEQFVLVNEYLGYLASRNYSPRAGRAFGYALLALYRWLLTREELLQVVHPAMCEGLERLAFQREVLL